MASTVNQGTPPSHHRTDIDEFWQLLRSAPGAFSSATVTREDDRGDYVIELLSLRRGDNAIRGYVTRPKATGRRPGILYAHAHGRRYEIGASELVDGRAALQGAYGPELARAGYVSICIDMPTFGERAQPGEDAMVKAALWRGTTLMGQMLGELSAAVGYLASRDDVDADRIGAFGISMGATHSYMLSALDPRIRAVAHLCCYADLETLIQLDHHDLHGHYLTIPGFIEATSVGRIAGLVAPRPQLICNGADDPLTPPAAIRRALDETEAAYERAAAADNLRCLIYPDTGHVETAAMRREVLSFLAQHLRPGKP